MGGITEILDVAPVDMIHSLSKKFIETFPGGDLFSSQYKAQALDIEVHWITEHGKDAPARLTSNITLLPTVRYWTPE
ncbi:hypothetical protein NW758_015027 [Fusarium oxysporum]|nr:hypothetical protein NW758_015027 [Fusarium oxysporum]